MRFSFTEGSTDESRGQPQRSRRPSPCFPVRRRPTPTEATFASGITPHVPVLDDEVAGLAAVRVVDQSARESPARECGDWAWAASSRALVARSTAKEREADAPCPRRPPVCCLRAGRHRLRPASSHPGGSPQDQIEPLRKSGSARGLDVGGLGLKGWPCPVRLGAPRLRGAPAASFPPHTAGALPPRISHQPSPRSTRTADPKPLDAPWMRMTSSSTI